MTHSMQVNVRKGHEFNYGNLEKYLNKHVTLFQGDGSSLRIHAIYQFQNGQSNPTFCLELQLLSNIGNSNISSIQKVVLRKKPNGKLLPSAHMIEREYMVTKALHKQAFPVAKPILFCDDPNIIGTQFFIMEFVEGRIFTDSTLSHTLQGPIELSPKDRYELYCSFLQTLAQLHSINYKRAGLTNFARVTTNYYHRQIQTWSRQYKQSETHKIEEMDKLINWLPKNIPNSHHLECIVHGDFKFDNVIFHPIENRVIAVTDWELSTIGHPYGDVAYSAIFYHFGSDVGFPGLKGLNLHGMGIPTEREYVDLYCKYSKQKPIQNWYFYVVFALFRLAGILQGVYKRAMQGNASSEKAKIIGARAAGLAYLAWSIVEDEIIPKQKKVITGSESLKTSQGGICFDISPRVEELRTKLIKFMETYVYPNESTYQKQISQPPTRWKVVPIIEELKQKAKEAGLWNLFLPIAGLCGSPGLNNVEYATLAEVIGRSHIAPEIFNCNAPDTGNMEVFLHFGTEKQKEMWLKPLLEGKIRSCFAMTEPDVASSDATNISCTIRKTSDGRYYVINGRKWWITGAGDPRCKVALVMGKTDPENPNIYKQQSVVIVPFDTSGVKVVRPLKVFGEDDAPSGHCEVDFDNVKVPVENIILGEGRGFEIAQQRLGPGRIHHMMRLIGLAERSLEQMCDRANSRSTFGKPLNRHGIIREYIAKSRIEIEQARLLVLKTAYLLDKYGSRECRAELSACKVAVPQMACNVIDRAIQVHGAGGFSNEDFGLASRWIGARSLRMADGPDEVHLESLAKLEMNHQSKKRNKSKL